MTTSLSKIPAEAVEAAAKAICMGTEGISRQQLEVALEAAAPYMLAGLRADLVKLAKEFDTAEGGTLAYTVSDGRHALRKNAHDQLMYVIDDHLILNTAGEGLMPPARNPHTPGVDKSGSGD